MAISPHSLLNAYFTKGMFSKRVKWFLKYKRWVNLVKDTSLGIVEFHFLNKDGEEIDLVKAAPVSAAATVPAE